jgi:hypothetical protein
LVPGAETEVVWAWRLNAVNRTAEAMERTWPDDAVCLTNADVTVT